MALLWCDGFDHYGVVGNLTEGAWAEVGIEISLVSDNPLPRTGSHCIKRIYASTASNSRMRRVLGGAKSTVGVAAVFYYENLPTQPNTDMCFDFRDANNAVQVTIGLDTTGTITAYRGLSNGTVLGVTAAPVITAETWQHVEAMVTFSNTVGMIEVRVNGVTVLALAGIDTVESGLAECSQVCMGGANALYVTAPSRMDDVFCYDDTGSFNNTFIGDRRVLTLMPDADTAQAEWELVGAATGYGCIDEIPPDADATYLNAPAATSQVSAFGFQNLPSGISAVNAVVVVEMARKTEAGIANTQWSAVSGAMETAGTDKPLTEIYTYRQDVFEADPNSGAPFTPAEVNALQIKVQRTA